MGKSPMNGILNVRHVLKESNKDVVHEHPLNQGYKV
jgi:hypothetical protein